ncbi:GNAT family N-acetyltransferase [Micromonospora sediminicola]|uniref:GNAT family N-acetyltransferase n=1 Tax=Micromonospora sediminicola TaxID=946078 RepID=UPI0033B010FD
MPRTAPISIELLADRPDLLPSVARLRWQEWGAEPGRQALQWWIDTTRSEAGREALPIAFVAVNSNGKAIGAVSLAPADLPERSSLTPWVVGTIVQADHRGAGVGGALLKRLHQWTAAAGFPRLWVATGGEAIDFYRHCGWRVAEVVDRDDGEQATVLTIEP